MTDKRQIGLALLRSLLNNRSSYPTKNCDYVGLYATILCSGFRLYSV